MNAELIFAFGGGNPSTHKAKKFSSLLEKEKAKKPTFFNPVSIQHNLFIRKLGLSGVIKIHNHSLDHGSNETRKRKTGTIKKVLLGSGRMVQKFAIA